MCRPLFDSPELIVLRFQIENTANYAQNCGRFGRDVACWIRWGGQAAPKMWKSLHSGALVVFDRLLPHRGCCILGAKDTNSCKASRKGNWTGGEQTLD